MRTKGALNKPKYMMVTVADINARFAAGTPIKISAEYASLFGVDMSAAPRVPTVTIAPAMVIPAAAPALVPAMPAGPAQEPEEEEMIEMSAPSLEGY